MMSGLISVEKTVKQYNRLDYAFNNAGIEEMTTPLVDQTSEVFDQIMNVNVKGVWLSMKYEIPEMIRTGGGAIIKTRLPECWRGRISTTANIYRKQTCCACTDQIRSLHLNMLNL